MTINTPSNDDIAQLVATSIRECFPSTWTVAESFTTGTGIGFIDVSIEIEAPDRRSACLLVGVTQTLDRRDVANILDQARDVSGGTKCNFVVAARYLSPSVRDALIDAELSFVDATGNLRIMLDSPAVFISKQGEDRDPWRRGRPRGTLKGEPAARVVRALLDYRRTWSAREIMSVAGSSSGATYRVLDYLEREDLAVKERTRYRIGDWERLLRAWSADSPFQATSRMMTCIEPRGVDYFLEKIGTEPVIPTAITGSIAAKQWATYAPAKAVYVYVSSIREASERWGLRQNNVAPNVVLLEPRTVGDVPFRNRTIADGGYPVAAPAQVAADLLNGPGREPAEGEFLLDWMKANEETWRRA